LRIEFVVLRWFDREKCCSAFAQISGDRKTPERERAAAGLFACTSPPQTKDGSYDIWKEPLPFYAILTCNEESKYRKLNIWSMLNQ
jgi:hypothetical protein